MSVKQFELKNVDKFGLTARTGIEQRHLKSLGGLILPAIEKSEPIPGRKGEFRVTHMIATAWAVISALEQLAADKIKVGGSGEAELVEAGWWSGWAKGVSDRSKGKLEVTLEGSHEKAMELIAEGKKRDAAFWNGYGVGIFTRPGKDIPAGHELIIPKAAGRVVELAAAA